MELINAIAPYVPQYAWPVLILVLGYAKIQSDRKKTREVRDADSTDLHDKILKHDFMIAQLKDNQTLQAQVLEDLRDAVSAMNVGVAKLEVSVTSLTEAVKELKK